MKQNVFIFNIFLLVLCLPLFVFGQSKKLVRQAKRLSDPKAQILKYTEAITLDANNLDAYFYRGLAKAELEDHFSAIIDFTKIIFFKPDADSYYNRGNSKFELGDLEGAYNDYVNAIAVNQDFFQALYNLGITQFHLKRYKGALRTFNTILKVFPDDLNTNIQMGLTLMELKYYPLSLIFMNKSIMLNRNTDTYHNRGIAYLDMRNYAKSKADFTKAIQLDNTNDSAHYYLGLCQLFSREFTKAAQSFKHVLSFNALDAEALVGLAISCYHTNKLQEAKQHFKKAKHILKFNDTLNTYKDDISLFKNTAWNTDEGIIFKAYFNRLNTL